MLARLKHWLRSMLAQLTTASQSTRNDSPQQMAGGEQNGSDRQLPVVKLVLFPRPSKRPISPTLPRDDNSTEPSTAALSPAVRSIASAWPTLPPHVRDAILTLVDAAQSRPD